MNEDRRSQDHPTAEDMAAYLDGQVTEWVRERIEAHAAECPECRREIAEVTAMLTRTRRTPSWRILVPAAAAAVMAVLLVRPLWMETEPDRARFRGPHSAVTADRPADIRTVSPLDATTVGPGGLAFVWYSAGSGASYQLTLTNDEGDVEWNLNTTDTVASLPDTIDLEPASTYHWYVDALLEDGWHTTSGVHSFTMRR